MIVLISHPENIQNEAQIINEILDQHSDVLFHLRKPDWNAHQAEDLLASIKNELHSRIVIHQHFELAEKLELKGIHLKEKDRKSGINSTASIISTSFHSLDDALNNGGRFEYFFCSPVFQSISKPDYQPGEEWDISGESELFRTKAVALGGIDASTRECLTEKGFENVAVLGSTWKSGRPAEAFTKIVRAFEQ